MSVSGRRGAPGLVGACRFGDDFASHDRVPPAAVIQPAPAAGDPPAKSLIPALPVDLTAVESDQPELVKPQVEGRLRVRLRHHLPKPRR